MSAAPEEPLPAVRLDVSRPHPARMYDWYLGGKDNYEVDRLAGEEVEQLAPQVIPSARENRHWMHRAVRFLVQQAGIRQFLDIGTGIPTEPNLHQIAQDTAPECRVVYVDYDPIVLSHARALMTSTAQGATAYLQADLREPETILSSPELRRTLDLSRPVALMLAAILHFITDEEEPGQIVSQLRDALQPGSYLALSHGTRDFDPKRADAAAAVYEKAKAVSTVTVRSRDQVLQFFDGCRLVAPGLVALPYWRPGIPMPRWRAEQVWMYGGVALIAVPPSCGNTGGAALPMDADSQPD